MSVMSALIIVATLNMDSVACRENHFSPCEWCTVRATHNPVDPLAPVEPRVKNLVTGIMRVFGRRHGAMSGRLDSGPDTAGRSVHRKKDIAAATMSLRGLEQKDIARLDHRDDRECFDWQTGFRVRHGATNAQPGRWRELQEGLVL